MPDTLTPPGIQSDEAAATTSRRSLVVGAGSGQLRAVRQLLGCHEYEVDSLRGTQDALLLAQHVHFDLILLRFPLPEMDPRVFFDTMRQESSACRGTAVFILADDEYLDAARLFVGRGANWVIPADDPCGALEGALAHGLRSAPRVATRLTTLLEAETHGGAEHLMCQTANLSETGMLLEAARKYGRGTRVRFSIILPNETGPSTGTAEVVRHTFGGREHVDGFGVRFLTLDGDSAERVAAYLRSGRDQKDCAYGTPTPTGRK
jgi:CheY-like chemotaxis protein